MVQKVDYRKWSNHARDVYLILEVQDRTFQREAGDYFHFIFIFTKYTHVTLKRLWCGKIESHLVQLVKCWRNFLELNPKGLCLSLEKEKENCCLQKTREEVSCRSRATRAKKWTKKAWRTCKSCCWSQSIAFLPFSLSSPSSLLNSLIMWPKCTN